MLRINLKRVFKSRGIDRPDYFLQSHGIKITTARRVLKGGYENFSLDTIENFCLLLHCTPNDLLEWTPTGDVLKTEPLHQLIRDNRATNIVKLINTAPLDKLAEMEAYIRKEMGL